MQNDRVENNGVCKRWILRHVSVCSFTSASMLFRTLAVMENVHCRITFYFTTQVESCFVWSNNVLAKKHVLSILMKNKNGVVLGNERQKGNASVAGKSANLSDLKK